MSKKTKKIDNRSTLITKVVLYTLFVATAVVGFSLLPKRVLTNDEIYNFSASLAERKEKNLVLYEYKVYATEKRFEEALVNDVNEKLLTFKNNKDVLMVKVNGEKYTETFKDNYWFVTDSEVPELNIEYYVMRNLTVYETSLPCYSFISYADDLFATINVVYLVLLIFVFLGIATPFTIGIARNLPKLINDSDIPTT